ncbi:MAG: PKD domain-containing protein, partial [Bacteroidetes bacterium]
MNIRLLFSFLFFAGLSSYVSAQCSGFTVNAGADQGVCFPAGTATLNGSVTGNYESFVWSPATGLSDPNILNPTAFVTAPITYTLTAQGVDPAAPNLIQNGDFEQGNVGFSSVYTNNQTNLINPGTYAIVPSPAIVLSTFPSCDDHTTGVGNMMVVHGQSSAGHNVWCQTVPVVPGNSYEFSAWIMTVVPFFPSSFDFTINGQSLGAQSFPANSICEWAEYSAIWNAGSATSATICIVDQGGGGIINGYALDDISLKALCSASDEVTLSLVNVEAVLPALAFLPCNVSAQGFALDGSASTSGPNISYLWQTGDGHIVSGATTPTAFVDQPGTYTLTVTYNDGFAVCTDLAVISVIPDPNVPLAFVQAPGEVNCFNPTITLDGSASSSGPEYAYLWTTADGHIVSGAQSPFAVVDMGGNYTLLVTNTTNGCTAETSVFVSEDLAEPTATAAANDVLTCIQNPVAIDGTGSSQGNEFSYEWTTSDGNIVSGENTLMPDVDAAGNYTLVVTNDQNGCTASVSVVVEENTTPPVVQIEDPNAVGCAQTTQTLDATGSSGGGTLSANWTTSDGNIVSGENTLTPTVDAAGTYTLTLTDDSNGCTAESSVTVEE